VEKLLRSLLLKFLVCSETATDRPTFYTNKTFIMSITNAQRSVELMQSPSGRQKIQVLLDSFRQSTHRTNSDRIGKEDSLMEFIPMKILDQMREEVMCTDEKILRAYFGRYPDGYEVPDLAGRQTLVYTVEALKYSPNRFIIPNDIVAFSSKGRMERQLADTLLTTYRRSTHITNSERIGKIDSASVFLSTLVSDEMREAIIMHGVAGVNIHFGRYPGDYGTVEMHDREIDVAGRQTLITIIGDLEQMGDRFIVPEDICAFFDYPVCPPFCNCIPSPKHPC
jgi:hypothetical protein